jgi:adenylate cyclase
MLRRVSWLRRIVGGALAWVQQIGADPADDAETRQRKALLVGVSVLILPISLVWGTLYLALGSPGGWIAYLYFAVSLAALLIFARTRDTAFLLRVQQLAILLAPTLSMIPVGGFTGTGAVGLWGLMAPMGALVFRDVRSGIRWFIAFMAVFAVSGVIGEVWHPLAPLPGWFTTTMLALNVIVAGSVVFMLLALFAQQRRDAQEVADSLLLNVLPRSIAERLKAQTQTIADSFSSASILFADVVDFTPRAEQLSAPDVVGLLDRLFGHFDALVERYDLEKIKTIGDCYMAAAGIPVTREDHARALALIALDMLEAVRANGPMGDLGLELRIGLNSGPVVAGVIGRKRFLYDLWGDAVNVADRMQTHGTPGRIQVTRSTYELLQDEFVLEPRGTIEVRGKGEMETWYLVGPREGLKAEA